MQKKIIFPKISVITVSYNSQNYIEETILSVINQTYSNIEYIIIDGGSTDGTLEIIKKYERNINYWVSEKDESMYDAINKGLKVASGEHIMILNSDDFFYNPKVLESIVNRINKGTENIIAYYGNIIKFRDGIKEKRKSFQVNKTMLLISQHSTFAPHPALIVSKEVFEKKLFYDLKYKYASDFDYILKLFGLGRVKYLNIDMTCFRQHSESITSSGKINNERLDILLEHGYYNLNIILRKLGFLFLWSFYKCNTWILKLTE